MTLTDPKFEAHFSYRGEDGCDHDCELEEATVLWFTCPCGKHSVRIPFKNPRKRAAERNGWMMAGTGLHDLTLSPSIDIGRSQPGGSCWHGFITNGQVTSV